MAQGEVLVDATLGDLTTYFTGVTSPVSVTGNTGGTLQVVGDDVNNLLEVIDALAAGGVDNATRVQAWSRDRNATTLSVPRRQIPYASLDFAGGAFASLVVDARGGDDVVDVVSFAASETGLQSDDGLGGAGNDALSVTDNAPSAASVTLDGGAGEDDLTGRHG